MAKIYSPVEDYCGNSAGVKFEKGVGVTDSAVAIAWFTAHGYTVVSDEIDLATLDKLNKDILIEIATKLEIDTTSKTKQQLVDAIRAVFVVGSISITSSTELSLVVGATSQIEASALPETALEKALTYSSSDETKATVSGTGLITAVAAGTSTITVASTEIPSVSGTIAVTVTTE